jgi:hypothetical protein
MVVRLKCSNNRNVGHQHVHDHVNVHVDVHVIVDVVGFLRPGFLYCRPSSFSASERCLG